MRLDSARLLLDAEAAAQLFAGLPTLRARRLHGGDLLALWVKPGRHFNACYRLRLADDTDGGLLGAAFVIEPTRGARVVAESGPHRSGGCPPSHCPHCCTQLVAPDVLVQIFPFDYRLPTLPACFDRERIRRLAGIQLDFVDCEPAAYRPGMRCQLRYRTSASAVYGKVAMERVPGQVFSMHRAVHKKLRRRARRVRVPEPLGYVSELRLALVASAPGESLCDALHAKRSLADEIQAVAEAAAELHLLAVEGVERVYGVSDELDLVRGWVALVAQLYPEHASALRACQTDLVRSQPEAFAPRDLVHRDFYDKQILISPDGVTLLDMDTLCLGEREIDLANFCAHLRLHGLQWDQGEPCRQLEEAFLGAYPAPVAADRLAWYRRSSLLRLACVYALRQPWRHLVPALLTEARQ